MRPVRQFVDRLSTMLRLPARRRQAIADELTSHLEDRVRDLELEGYSQSEALKFAISELGEMKELAHCLQQANRMPYRRIAMNTLIITGTVGALTAAGLFVVDEPMGPSDGMSGAVAPGLSEKIEEDLARKEIELPVDGTDLFNIAESLARSEDLTLFIHPDIGEDRLYQPILALREGSVSVQEVVDRASLDLYGSSEVIILVENEGRLELGTQEGVDRRSTSLICYSIDDTLRGMVLGEDATTTVHSPQEAAQSLTRLIQDLVYPDLWHGNGGHMASIHVASGGRMFIDAPQRVHDRLAWVIRMLPSMTQEDVNLRLKRGGRGWGHGANGADGGFGGQGGAGGGFGGEGGADGGFGGEGGAGGGFGGEDGADGGFGGEGGAGGGFGGGAGGTLRPDDPDQGDWQRHAGLLAGALGTIEPEGTHEDYVTDEDPHAHHDAMIDSRNAAIDARQRELEEQLRMKMEQFEREAREYEKQLEQRKQAIEKYAQKQNEAIELRKMEVEQAIDQRRGEIELYIEGKKQQVEEIMSQHEQAFRATEQKLNERRQELEQWTERLRLQEENFKEQREPTYEEQHNVEKRSTGC